MAICQYWQRGQCRFGNECRFEHSTGGVGFGGQLPQGNRQNAAAPQGDITNTLVTTVKQDIEQWEKGNQWIFSCYAPAKETACFPGEGNILRWLICFENMNKSPVLFLRNGRHKPGGNAARGIPCRESRKRRLFSVSAKVSATLAGICQQAEDSGQPNRAN